MPNDPVKIDRENELETALFQFLCRKYTQRSDARQLSMGLQYTQAETHDLAKELTRFFGAHLAALPPCGMREALEVEKLREKLRPFHAAVFNDNGDVTVSTGHIEIGDWLALYRATRQLDAALSAPCGAGCGDARRPVETQQSITEWANETFGLAGSNARVAARANEEMAELLRALTADDNHPKAAEEVADVMIIMQRLATRLGIRTDDEIDRKMAINRQRVWKKDNTGHGYHVRDKSLPAAPATGGV